MGAVRSYSINNYIDNSNYNKKKRGMKDSILRAEASSSTFIGKLTFMGRNNWVRMGPRCTSTKTKLSGVEAYMRRQLIWLVKSLANCFYPREAFPQYFQRLPELNFWVRNGRDQVYPQYSYQAVSFSHNVMVQMHPTT